MMETIVHSPAGLPAFALPAQGTGDPAPVESAYSSLASSALRDKRVVIVEDEGFTVLHLRKVCALAGMRVVAWAGDGEEGARKVLETQPDLVLMDINMPVLDGFDATERILKTFPVCVVMLTAYNSEEYRERARTLGTCGYVLKPVTAPTLIPQLEAALAEFRRKSA